LDGKVELFGGRAYVPGSTDGSLEDSRFALPVSLAMDEENEMLYVADRYNKAIREISIANRTVSTLVVFSGSANMKITSRSIVLHKDTGDLFVLDNDTHLLRLSKVKSDTQTHEWTPTPISIDLSQGALCALAIFGDTLFLLTFRGSVLQSSLDGKRASFLVEVPKAVQESGIKSLTAGANAVYMTHSKGGFIAKITWRFWWSARQHNQFGIELRKLIRFIVVASLCYSKIESKSQLNKLPKEILLHVLSFLDNSL
jgi:DNA-binding beta-propeller fold protein YncE